MGRKLLIVESGKKAKTVGKLLGPDWIVKSCYGHVCDLPRKEYGVDKATFEETYTQSDDRQKRVVSELRKASKGVDHVYIGSDPDREGEAIGWHLVRLLGLKGADYSRVEWNEITDAGIKRALASPGQINADRVEAQRARRVLDRIVGYDVSSELCWPAGYNAAGRVQTPTLHILCEREREIAAFVPEDYYNLGVTYSEGFDAFVPEKIVEESVDDDGNIRTTKRIRAKRFPTEAEATAAKTESEANTHTVRAVDRRQSKRSPEAAYDTATLQRDAGTKLGLSPKQTMDQAQSLYEDGRITYMRTDATRLSDEAVEMARRAIAEEHPEALSESPNTGRAGEQDGHEAVRPTALGVRPEDLPDGTAPLYAMILARFLATQCKPAVFDRTAIHIVAGSVEWLAQGSVLVDPGFLVYWAPYARMNDTTLPSISDGQTLAPIDYSLEKKRTSPPPRYSEPDLVMRMKKGKIGRPATYAGTLEALKRHGYVEIQKAGKKKTHIVPTNDGMVLDGLMTATVPELVTEDYTAQMEASLEKIEDGLESRVDYLRPWYEAFAKTLRDAQPRAGEYRKEHNLRPKARGGSGEETQITCDLCGEATYLKLTRRGNKGKFLKCSDEACGFTRDIRAKTRKCSADGCSGTLVERKRKDGGSFMTCARADCDHTENVDGTSSGGGMYAREDTDKPCPRCEKTTLALFKLRKPVEGRGHFFSCPERKKCGFSLDFGARRHKVPCEKCGGMMLERTSKKGDRFWGCAKCPQTRPLTPATE